MAKKASSSDKEGSSSTRARGPGFTLEEDLLVSKAYIAASEDPINGSGKKRSDFEASLKRCYDALCQDRAREKMTESAKQDQIAVRASINIGKAPQPSKSTTQISFPDRTATSLMARFTRVISPVVTKFLALKSRHKKESGEDEAMYMARLRDIFKGQNKGVPFEHIEVADFLQKQAKWMSYSTSSSTDVDAFSLPRPIGKKKAQELKMEELKATKVISVEGGCVDNRTSGDVDKKRSGDTTAVLLANIQKSSSEMSQFFSQMSAFMGSVVKECEDKREKELPEEIRKELMIQRARVEIARRKREADQLENELVKAPSSARHRQSLGTVSTVESESTISEKQRDETCDLALRPVPPTEVSVPLASSDGLAPGSVSEIQTPQDGDEDRFDIILEAHNWCVNNGNTYKI
jgi:hypothetical protein